ncbi:hypothetical protein MMC31_001628, partial [Peltigera leucophlebia]|nr:hypothetical protein [Peltigera leucophlebia]
NAISEHQNQIRLRKSEENSIILAKYLSSRINRPTTPPTSLLHSQNSQASENLAAVSSASRRDSETIVNNNFHFSDYLNNSGGEEEDQSVNQDDNLDNPQNSGGTSDEDTSVSSNDNPKTGSAEKVISDDEDNDEELMPDSEKAKWVLADNLLEAMELHFESLGFQNMAQFYGMKNMGGLKQHRDFKKRHPVEAAEKIQKTRKIFAEQVGIGEYLTRKQ